MSEHWIFNGCDEAVKAELKNYWEEKWPRLEKLLSHDRPDLRDVRLTVYGHEQPSGRAWYELRVVIHLPTGTLLAEVSDEDPRVLLDRAVDKLVNQLRRHKAQVRKDYVFKRKRRQRADLSAAGPLLDQDVKSGRKNDFFRLLRPHLRLLRNYAAHELRSLEMDGILYRGEMNVADLLDEVVVRAWKQFENRPKTLPLDLWLIHLIHDVLEDWIKQEPRRHVSVDDEAGVTLPDEVPQVDDQEWWKWLLGDVETVTLQDIIADAESDEPASEVEDQEQRDRLLALLGELPPKQRQAFVLHALEDYEPAEIALVQDRSESEVQADLDAARSTLKNLLTSPGELRAG